MLNDLILVGRLTREITVFTTDTGKKVGTLSLAVPRSFRNMDGVYETDFISCTLWEEKAKIASTYCHVGDIVGVKGRLQSKTMETEIGRRTLLEVVAERVTFLSSNQKKQENVSVSDKEDVSEVEKP